MWNCITRRSFSEGGWRCGDLEMKCGSDNVKIQFVDRQLLSNTANRQLPSKNGHQSSVIEIK
jgi:hypothetical protein